MCSVNRGTARPQHRFSDPDDSIGGVRMADASVAMRLAFGAGFVTGGAFTLFGLWCLALVCR